jgi:hypothetical protein
MLAMLDAQKPASQMARSRYLVTDSDQKVLTIDNPTALQGQEGHYVQIRGNMTDQGSLHVETVKQSQ